MDRNLNAVKNKKLRATPYHHGALREALIAAAETELVERGIEGFSLRSVARRAGVSPAAPAHHFGDTRGLRTAVAITAFEDFARALEDADDVAPRDVQGRVRAQCVAYIGFAIANSARFDLMWRIALLDSDSPKFVAAADAAFAVLQRAVGGQGFGPTDASDRLPSPAAVACWSMIHGFTRLALDGSFGVGIDAARAAADKLLPAVLEHLEI